MLVSEIAKVDEWAKRNISNGTRQEAIRQLITIGLASSKPIARTNRQHADKAKAMAGKAIDRAMDDSLAPEQRVQRKRHLVKGPREFRDIRRDR